MKGIVMNLLEKTITDQFGEATWDTLLEKSGVEGTYTSLGNYPDEHLFTLVGSASELLQKPPQEVVRWFGNQALPELAQRFPQFFTPHQSVRPFILTLNNIIHPEVRKLYPGADVPEFIFDDSSPEALIMEYNSKRKLCAFAHGMIEGAAAHYGETVHAEEVQCMHHGADSCIFRFHFSPV